MLGWCFVRFTVYFYAFSVEEHFADQAWEESAAVRDPITLTTAAVSEQRLHQDSTTRTQNTNIQAANLPRRDAFDVEAAPHVQNGEQGSKTSKPLSKNRDLGSFEGTLLENVVRVNINRSAAAKRALSPEERELLGKRAKQRFESQDYESALQDYQDYIVGSGYNRLRELTERKSILTRRSAVGD